MPATPSAAGHGGAAAAASFGVAAVVLAGCAAPPAPPVRLTIERASYDCVSRVLVVEGGSVPATGGLEVQVQVRSDADRRGVVWQRATSAGDGRWRARGRELAVAREVATGPATVVVRAGAVTEGVRVFSARYSLPVRCPLSPP